MKLGRLCLAILSLVGLATLSPAHGAETTRVRGVVQLSDSAIDGIRIAELSGLAWDAGAQVLYGVSDRGRLFRFRLELTDEGRLQAVVPLGAHAIRPLRPDSGRQSAFDTEGLAWWPQDPTAPDRPQLLVATEGQPQVLRLSLKGQIGGPLALPSPLDDRSRYGASNTMLEALTYSQAHGLLVAPEVPLRGADPGLHTVYAHQRSWRFPVHTAGRSRLKAMDVTDDGQLVVLERSRKGKGKGKGLVNVLRQIDLARCSPQEICEVRDLMEMTRSEGADNFEGMAWLGGHRFLLVSDNLGSRHLPTLFMLIDVSATARE